jgi:hypothetical protein
MNEDFPAACTESATAWIKDMIRETIPDLPDERAEEICNMVQVLALPNNIQIYILMNTPIAISVLETNSKGETSFVIAKYNGSA